MKKWNKKDPRYAFVMGAKWWEYHKTKATMWQSDVDLAEVEAERRYPRNKKIKEEET